MESVYGQNTGELSWLLRIHTKVFKCAAYFKMSLKALNNTHMVSASLKMCAPVGLSVFFLSHITGKA